LGRRCLGSDLSAMADPEYLPQRPSLIGSRLKIERAEQHLDELQPKIQAYIERDPYVVSNDPEMENEWMVVRFGEVREHPDTRWGIRVGELLHDLRSALDNLVWQLVQLNGKQPGDHNQFPIYTKAPDKARHRALRGVRGATRIDDMLLGVRPADAAVIKELQPYLGLHIHRGHKVALASVALFNNIDKHKFVHPAVGISGEGDDAEVERVQGPPPSRIDVHYRLGAMYEGAEVFRWRIIGGTDETVVQMKGGVPFDIAFGHRNATLGHLDWMKDRISEVVERFADAFAADPDEA
jgi:hypothetical protein